MVLPEVYRAAPPTPSLLGPRLCPYREARLLFQVAPAAPISATCTSGQISFMWALLLQQAAISKTVRQQQLPRIPSFDVMLVVDGRTSVPGLSSEIE